MNYYFKNHALLVFFSFLVIPALAMENENSTPSQVDIVAKFALLYLPKKEEMAIKNKLLLEKNEIEAQNWFNEGTKPENQPIDPLLAYFLKRGDNVPPINQFSFDLADYQVNPHFVLPSKMTREKIEKIHLSPKNNGLPHKNPPISTSDLVSPVDGRKEPLLQKIGRQNCLIM